MPKMRYVEKRFSDGTLDMIRRANAILEEYTANGYVLTLRQLYYQFVARDLLPNTERSYKNLGVATNNGRLAGMIDWSHLIDRTRNLNDHAHWGHPKEIIRTAARQYREDVWRTQPRRVEVWIEKDALLGVIEGVCQELDVPYFSCRGYTSQSETWAAAMRIRKYREDKDQSVLIVHLGDHDPSGVDMTRDISDRLSLLSQGPVEVDRIALNFDQVEEHGPPPNPTKISDSRSDTYIRRFGYESWELDALEPEVISSLVRERIEREIDRPAMDAAQAVEKRARAKLSRMSERFDTLNERKRR